MKPGTAVALSASMTTSQAATASADAVPIDVILPSAIKMLSPLAMGSRQSPVRMVCKLTIADFMFASLDVVEMPAGSDARRPSLRTHHPKCLLNEGVVHVAKPRDWPHFADFNQAVDQNSVIDIDAHHLANDDGARLPLSFGVFQGHRLDVFALMRNRRALDARGPDGNRRRHLQPRQIDFTHLWTDDRGCRVDLVSKLEGRHASHEFRGRFGIAQRVLPAVARKHHERWRLG